MTPMAHRRFPAGVLRSVLVCLVAAAPQTLGAHEIGTTRVGATFSHDDTYAIDVVADASALLNRLELAKRQPLSSLTTYAEFQQAFDHFCADVTTHLSIAFDDVESVPTPTCVVDKEKSDPSNPFDVLGVTVTLRGAMPPGARTFRWRYDLASAQYALTLRPGGPGDARTTWLDGSADSGPLALVRAAPPSRTAIASTYFGLGFTHILPKGLDHILFVLGLFLLSRKLSPILWQVSAFTVAHSITLGLTIYGVISLSPSIVEPLIALSIVYVAVENLLTSELKPWRVALVFGFGLLHGMGFAGVLRELALPRSEFLTGLVAFNVGVEAGQLAVILGAFLVVGTWAQRTDTYRRLVIVPCSTAIALTGLLWTVERLGM
jgi:hydrogenase/urease accessory protein HupE